ncbi:MAG: hypothetical protein ABL929_05310 [Ferruginibacter sp.]|nr:hypothetical protein [Ferruginibacter sp.]
MKQVFIIFFSLAFLQSQAQKKSPVTISGTAGVTYEGYGLTTRPVGWAGYPQRRPWNQVRFNFMPTINFSKNFSMPMNFNFAAFPTNFAGPFAGIKNQNIGQYLTNPMNNFGLNPTYKWAEFQLGTQYLKYSDLSTGDIGIFGAGFSLKPGDYRFKFFAGQSQQGINYAALPAPGVLGAYKRTHYMFSIGKEKENNYLLAFNFAKGKDNISSAIIPPPVPGTPTPLPEEGFTVSMQVNKDFKKGYYIKSEGANSIYTTDENALVNPAMKGFKPFIEAKNSTKSDYAANLSFGKKSTNFDLGMGAKYVGAGFQLPGYPYMQPDKFDYTINTRFNAWKNKSNVVASIGQRFNNVSGSAPQTKQLIGMLNWFTQFNDKFSLNVSFNNFGFNTPGVLMPGGTSIKNVSTDAGVNPTYTWTNTKMSNTLSLSYNYSNYKETLIPFGGGVGTTTLNNTHTGLLSYIPVYFTKKISPDFSLLYFYNDASGAKITFATISAGLAVPVAKDKVKLRGQLQYTLSTFNSFTPENNIIASCNVDVKLSKKFTWTNYFTTNYYKYGNALGVPYIGANYLESAVRTGFQYRF